MIIYNGTKAQFARDVIRDVLADKLDASIQEKLHRKTGQSERHSWINSSQYMYKILSDSQIPDDAGIALEYNIPQTVCRV